MEQNKDNLGDKELSGIPPTASYGNSYNVLKTAGAASSVSSTTAWLLASLYSVGQVVTQYIVHFPLPGITTEKQTDKTKDRMSSSSENRNKLKKSTRQRRRRQRQIR
jgi:hypothetical protein